MKYSLLIGSFLLPSLLLIGCATSGPADTAPALGAQSRITSRQPSPSNFQRNQMMDASRMTVPQQ